VLLIAVYYSPQKSPISGVGELATSYYPCHSHTADELEKVVKDIDPQLLEGYTVDDLMQEVDMDGDNVLDATELARFRVRTMLIPATCP